MIREIMLSKPLERKIAFQWAGKSIYQQLLTNSFKSFISTDQYAEMSREEREECLLFMEHLGELVQDVDEIVKKMKNNST